MAVYKLRVTFEDYEDIYRDIEIKSSQTFFELHQVILQSVGFDSKHAASFFVSDEYWRKHDEITLLEEDLEPGVKMMNKVKIASTVVQPNQRYIYLYDKQVLWSFMIELIKLVPEDIKAQYPRCIKTVGQAPKQYKQQLLDKLKEKEQEESLLGKAPLIVEDEIYRAVADEKLVFDEEESQAGDLHDDENALVDGDDDHEGEEGEEHEGADEHFDEEGDH